MYRSSLEAMQATIRQAVPGNDPFYVEALPGELTLPAFYLRHMASSAETAGVSTVDCHIQWQVMYFPQLSGDGTPDGLAQLAVADQLRQAFMREPVVKAPDGTLFQVEAFTGGTGEAGMFLAVTLSAQFIQSSGEPEAPLMRELHWKGL
ncbi:MAG: hypothetical protein K0Q90_640 [Paenibacillaceae bacterium]|jgi:hypothetical protein|nr:hypothetical protein [Paenibacillaceae bacterium]